MEKWCIGSSRLYDIKMSEKKLKEFVDIENTTGDCQHTIHIVTVLKIFKSFKNLCRISYQSCQARYQGMLTKRKNVRKNTTINRTNNGI